MAVMRLRFKGSGSDKYYLDLAREISLAQRRMERQKQTFTVLGGYFKDQDGSTAHFNTAPLTWPAKRAVNRGFSKWRKMIAKTLSNSDGSQSGKYSDFKVYLNKYQFDANTLRAVDAAGNNLYDSVGEWDYATMTTEDPEDGAPADAYDLHIVGDHNGSNPDFSRVGLIKSWIDSRPKPASETPVTNTETSTDPLANLFDAGDVDDDRMEIIEEENDHPPYDEDTMWGFAPVESGNDAEESNLQRVSSCQPSSSNPIVPIHGFQALCGLVQVDITSSSGWEFVLDVECNGVGF